MLFPFRTFKVSNNTITEVDSIAIRDDNDERGDDTIIQEALTKYHYEELTWYSFDENIKSIKRNNSIILITIYRQEDTNNYLLDFYYDTMAHDFYIFTNFYEMTIFMNHLLQNAKCWN